MNAANRLPKKKKKKKSPSRSTKEPSSTLRNLSSEDIAACDLEEKPKSEEIY